MISGAEYAEIVIMYENVTLLKHEIVINYRASNIENLSNRRKIATIKESLSQSITQTHSCIKQ